MPPPVLFVHGMWSRPSTFETLRTELAAVGVESRAPALPFHELPPGAEAPEGLADIRLQDYVAALLPEAKVLGRHVICGHSMGGLLAQLVASRVRPAGLILLSSAPSSAAQAFALSPYRTLAGVTLGWGWWERPTLIDRAGARWGIFNTVPEEEQEGPLQELTWDSGRVLAQIAFPKFDSSNGAAVDYARLQGLPCLLICGSEDRITPHRVTARTGFALGAAGAQVEMEMLPGVGHWLFHDAVRPRVAQAIARFLSGL
ncbi:MAG: alpha/beta hydrolase [Thermaurantiacus sp.]